MGCYINLENCEKKEFLAEHGELIYDIDEFAENALFLNFDSILKQNKLPVVLVDNLAFTAAGWNFKNLYKNRNHSEYNHYHSFESKTTRIITRPNS